MSTSSDSDAYSYAKFLVEMFPDDAIDILRTKGTWDIIKLVEKQVDSACIKLGGRSRTAIKGMVEDSQWEDLKNLKIKGGSPFHPATSPRDYHRMGAPPPTPSSTASRSPHLQRRSNQELITVYHKRAEVHLTSKPSGSDEYLIGEDKLDRFPGLTPEWIDQPMQVNLGGNPIMVVQYIQLAWNYGEGETFYNKFWVISAGEIRLADVLLGNIKKPHRSGSQGKEAVDSPLSLPQASHVPPHVPIPPQRVLYQPGRPSSSVIYSIPGNTIREDGQNGRNNMTVSSHLPFRPPGKTATMISGSVIHHDHSSGYAPASMDGPPPPRTGSAASDRTARSTRSEIILIQLSFEGKGKRLVPLDLTKSADEVLPFLESHISKMTADKQLDLSIYEMEIFHLKENVHEPESSSLLSDLEYSWDAMVEFMRENRTEGTKKAEFRLAISS